MFRPFFIVRGNNEFSRTNVEIFYLTFQLCMPHISI